MDLQPKPNKTMSTEKWLAATVKYQEENYRKHLEQLNERKAEEARREQEQRELERRRNELRDANEKMDLFMMSEGIQGMRLLHASRRHIALGESNEGGGISVVYFMNGDGFHQCVESTSMSAAFGNGSNPRPVPTRITVQQAIAAAVNYGGKKPTEVVEWLKGELDKIAEAAPEV